MSTHSRRRTSKAQDRSQSHGMVTTPSSDVTPHDTGTSQSEQAALETHSAPALAGIEQILARSSARFAENLHALSSEIGHIYSSKLAADTTVPLPLEQTVSILNEDEPLPQPTLTHAGVADKSTTPVEVIEDEDEANAASLLTVPAQTDTPDELRGVTEAPSNAVVRELAQALTPDVSVTAPTEQNLPATAVVEPACDAPALAALEPVVDARAVSDFEPTRDAPVARAAAVHSTVSRKLRILARTQPERVSSVRDMVAAALYLGPRWRQSRIVALISMGLLIVTMPPLLYLLNRERPVKSAAPLAAIHATRGSTSEPLQEVSAQPLLATPLTRVERETGSNTLLTAPSALPSTPPTSSPVSRATATPPLTTSPEAAILLQRIAANEAALRTGQLEVIIEDRQGFRSAAEVRFDLGDGQQAQKLHIVTAFGNVPGVQTVERITIGDQSWQRELNAAWTAMPSQVGVWGVIQGYLPHAVDTANLVVESTDDGAELNWYDTGRNADITLKVDVTTATPRKLQQVTRGTGSQVTVIYTDWNSPVEILPPVME